MFETPLRDNTFFSSSKHELQPNDLQSEQEEVCLIGQRHVTTKVHYLSRIIIERDTFFVISIFVVNALIEQNILYILQLLKEAAKCNQKDVENFSRTAFKGNQC